MTTSWTWRSTAVDPIRSAAWLALAGNYLGRLGVARLLELSREAAARVIARQA